MAMNKNENKYSIPFVENIAKKINNFRLNESGDRAMLRFKWYDIAVWVERGNHIIKLCITNLKGYIILNCYISFKKNWIVFGKNRLTDATTQSLILGLERELSLKPNTLAVQEKKLFFYTFLADDIFNYLDEPDEDEGILWAAKRLLEIAKKWHYSHLQMRKWANQDDSTKVFNEIYK